MRLLSLSRCWSQPCLDCARNVFERKRYLLTAGKYLDSGRVFREFAGSDNDGQRDAPAVSELQLVAYAALGLKGKIYAQTVLAQPVSHAGSVSHRVLHGDHGHIRHARCGWQQIVLAHHFDDAFESERHASRWHRSAEKGADESVIAPSAADRATLGSVTVASKTGPV